MKKQTINKQQEEKLYLLRHGGLYLHKRGWVTQKKYADAFTYEKAIEIKNKYLKNRILLDIEEQIENNKNARR